MHPSLASSAPHPASALLLHTAFASNQTSPAKGEREGTAAASTAVAVLLAEPGDGACELWDAGCADSGGVVVSVTDDGVSRVAGGETRTRKDRCRRREWVRTAPRCVRLCRTKHIRIDIGSTPLPQRHSPQVTLQKTWQTARAAAQHPTPPFTSGRGNKNKKTPAYNPPPPLILSPSANTRGVCTYLNYFENARMDRDVGRIPFILSRRYVAHLLGWRRL